jgi:hypothetical protein
MRYVSMLLALLALTANEARAQEVVWGERDSEARFDQEERALVTGPAGDGGSKVGPECISRADRNAEFFQRVELLSDDPLLSRPSGCTLIDVGDLGRGQSSKNRWPSRHVVSPDRAYVVSVSHCLSHTYLHVFV